MTNTILDGILRTSAEVKVLKSRFELMCVFFRSQRPGGNSKMWIYSS